ncbi:TPA: mechanosensitive ion channel protein, partial [Streptococcus pneumoniae]
MQKFIQAYIEKLDVTSIIENILTKVISLLLLLIVFY